MYDAIIAGSGIGGMVAAITLAQKNKKVLMLEAGKQFGGYMNPFARKKFHFDVGLHYIGECGPGQKFSRLMEQLDIADRVAFRELTPDGFDRYVLPDYEVLLCKGQEMFMERLAADFPDERDGLARYFKFMDDLNVIMNAVMQPTRPSNALILAKHLPTMLRFGRATLGEVLDTFLKDPLLKNAISAPCGDLGLPPSRISAMYHTMLLSHYLGGGYYPVGGSGAVRDAMIDKFKELGGELKRNARITTFHTKNGKVTGVTTARDEHFEAKTIISNLDATVLYGELLPKDIVPAKLQTKAASTTQSFASICAYAATDLDVSQHGMTDANIWHYESNDLDEVYAPVFEGKVPDKQGFFITVPTLKDPDGERAPDGVHTVELITLANIKPFDQWRDSKTQKRGDEYKAFKEEMMEPVLDIVESKYIPGLRDHLLHYEVSSPLTNISYTFAPEGAIYGPAHTPDQVGPWRFGAKSPVGGLYLCGASVIGCGVVPCAQTGRLAARMALKDGVC